MSLTSKELVKDSFHMHVKDYKSDWQVKLNFDYFCIITVNLVLQPIPGRYLWEPDG